MRFETFYSKWLLSYCFRYNHYIDYLEDKKWTCTSIPEAMLYMFAVVHAAAESALLAVYMSIIRKRRKKQFARDLQYIVNVIAQNAHYRNRQTYDSIFRLLEDLKNDAQTREDVNRLLFVANYCNKMYFD